MSELVRHSGHEARDFHNLVFNHYTKNHERELNKRGNTP